MKSKLVFLKSNGEASAPGGNSGIHNDGSSNIFITRLPSLPWGSISMQQMKEESGSTDQAWKQYALFPPMFHCPELSFMAMFPSGETEKCGLSVFPGGRESS